MRARFWIIGAVALAVVLFALLRALEDHDEAPRLAAQSLPRKVASPADAGPNPGATWLAEPPLDPRPTPTHRGTNTTGTTDVATNQAEANEAVLCSNRIDGECGFLHPSEEELLEMARCATVKSDYPEGLLTGNGGASFPLPEATIEAASLGEGERELILRATDEFREEAKKQMQSILIDSGGSREDIAEMSLEGMKAALKSEGSTEEVERVHRQIARERAGLDRPATARTPTEKFERFTAGLGDAYEQKLAHFIGPARAAELRAVGDGWSWRSVSSGQCEPAEILSAP